MSSTSTTLLTYGDKSVALADLPPASVLSLARKGLAHYLGNEMASKVTTWKNKLESDNQPVPDEAAIKAKRDEFTQTAWEALLNGTVGDSSRGPRGTAVETIARNIAEKELRENLKAAKKVMPTGNSTIELTNRDGTTSVYTRAQMIARRLAHPQHGPRIMKQAEKEMAALAKQSRAAETHEGDSILDA